MRRIRIRGRVERLSERSFLEAGQNKKICPFLKMDNMGHYCTKNLGPKEEISDERREICDSRSMEIFCMNEERYAKCSFYLGNLSI